MKDNALQRLPRELRIQILELLQLPSDLAALSATCKALRQVAEPFLYSSIRLQLDNDSLDPPVGLLLRTLLERSDLAMLIRHLKLEGNQYAGLHWNPSKDKLRSRIFQPEDKLDKAIKSLDLPQQNSWHCNIQSGNPDATVSLTISLCLNLISLRMDHNWLAQTQFLDSLLREIGLKSAGCPFAHDSEPRRDAAILQSLQDIELIQTYDHGRNFTPRDIHNVLHLFYLPNIQRLSAPIVNPTKFSWPLEDKPKASNLTSLELSRVREGFLGEILSPLKNLRRLRYNWMLQEDLDRHVNRDTTIDLDAIGNALLPLKETLQELVIFATTGPSEIEPPVFWLRGSLTRISQLERLRKLQLPWDFVAGVWEVAPTGSIGAIVPVSLECLAMEMSLGFDSGADVICHDWEDANVLTYIRDEFQSGALRSCLNLRRFAIPGPDHMPLGPEIAAEMDRLSKDYNITLSFFDNFNPLQDD